MYRPRVRKAAITKGGGERYVDAGPGKRVWAFTILAVNDLVRYDGQLVGLSGQQFRDALLASYAKVATTLSFTDPHGVSWTVRFDDYVEEVRDLRTQLTSASYLCRVELVEA
jgi:hypothetical protein